MDSIVVVEGPTMTPRPGVHALVVETDRVILGVASDGRARLVELRDGSIAVTEWAADDLEAIDAAQAGEGRRLLSRHEDREGTDWRPDSPWHVSRFGP